MTETEITTRKNEGKLKKSKRYKNLDRFNHKSIYNSKTIYKLKHFIYYDSDLDTQFTLIKRTY